MSRALARLRFARTIRLLVQLHTLAIVVLLATCLAPVTATVVSSSGTVAFVVVINLPAGAQVRALYSYDAGGLHLPPARTLAQSLYWR